MAGKGLHRAGAPSLRDCEAVGRGGSVRVRDPRRGFQMRLGRRAEPHPGGKDITCPLEE